MDRTCQFATALPVTPLPSVVRVRGICRCMCRFRICGSGGFCPPSGWQTGMLCADAVGVPAVRHVSVVPAGHFPPALHCRLGNACSSRSTLDFVPSAAAWACSVSCGFPHRQLPFPVGGLEGPVSCQGHVSIPPTVLSSPGDRPYLRPSGLCPRLPERYCRCP